MKILLIGGSDADRAALSDALEAAGHQVSAAVTRRFTNRWLSRRIKPFDLILYDTVEAQQPDEFWVEFREAAGTTRVVLLTNPDDPRDYQYLGFEMVLRHPVPVNEIIAVANRA
jgi:DNA-binding response OmpR family regulator